MRQLAHDDDIAVAGPVLTQSARLQETELVELAKTKGQAHLAVIAGREGIGEAVTDVLVRRGDTEVMRNVADNQIRQAVGGRLLRAGQARGRRRRPGRKGRPAAGHPAASVPRSPGARHRGGAAAPVAGGQAGNAERDPARSREGLQGIRQQRAGARLRGRAARRSIALHQAGKLGEPELAEFAKDKKFEETVAALSLLCGVPIETADRLMAGDRPDPILILCKAAGYGWTTARAIIMARPSAKGTSNPALDAAFANFEKLSPSTAQRVVRFWQVRQPEGGAGLAAVYFLLKIR